MRYPRTAPSEIRRRLARFSPLFAAAALAGAVALALSPIGFSAPEDPRIAVAAPAPISRPFPSVELQAASAIVVDLGTGRALFERDADAVRPLASITKLVTAIVASDRLDGDASVTIASAVETEESTATYTIPPQPILGPDGAPMIGEDGEALFTEAQVVALPPTTHTVPVIARVRDAISYALVASSNEASAALAVAAGPGQASFVEEMNAAAHDHGARTMSFRNPTGLDEAAEPGAVGSARDVAAILGYLVQHRPALIAPTAEVSVSVPTDHGAILARNTNLIAGALPNLVGGKTGLETSAGGNLAVVIDPGLGQPIAIVVLGSTKEGRFADVSALAAATVAYLSESDAAVGALPASR